MSVSKPMTSTQEGSRVMVVLQRRGEPS
jgi:hypothetical protein